MCGRNLSDFVMRIGKGMRGCPLAFVRYPIADVFSEHKERPGGRTGRPVGDVRLGTGAGCFPLQGGGGCINARKRCGWRCAALGSVLTNRIQDTHFKPDSPVGP